MADYDCVQQLGTIIERGKKITAYTVTGARIGSFNTRQAAAAAISLPEIAEAAE